VLTSSHSKARENPRKNIKIEEAITAVVVDLRAVPMV
jgi:hypothetical protein